MAPLVEEIVKQRIVEQLMWDDSVNANDVHVDILDDTARLSGTVPNYTAKIAAERNALLVEGVNNVENLLEVKFPPSVTIPPDDEIQNNLNSIFSWYDDFTGEIKAEVHKNVVKLSGIVNSYREKAKAEEIANSVRGVMDVQNHIQVKQEKEMNDSQIEHDIWGALKRNVLIDESKIDVDVMRGVVHLKGMVSNTLVKKEISNVAYYTRGVKKVVNELLVL